MCIYSNAHYHITIDLFLRTQRKITVPANMTLNKTASNFGLLTESSLLHSIVNCVAANLSPFFAFHISCLSRQQLPNTVKEVQKVGGRYFLYQHLTQGPKRFGVGAVIKVSCLLSGLIVSQ